MPSEPERSLDEIIRKDGRYPPEAYSFLNESLARAVKSVHGGEGGRAPSQHVRGQDICQAFRELALERWGMLARVVLARWNIRHTMDLGNMYVLLVDNKVWRTSEDDSVEDFRDVFDFAEVFDRPQNFELKE